MGYGPAPYPPYRGGYGGPPMGPGYDGLLFFFFFFFFFLFFKFELRYFLPLPPLIYIINAK